MTSPFGSSSALESPILPSSAGPAPGVKLVEELPDHSFVWRPYSYFGLSGDDAFWGNVAYATILKKYGGGILRCVGSSAIYTLYSQVTVPQNPGVCSLQGAGLDTTIFQPLQAGAGIYCHRTVGYGTQFGLPAQQHMGFIRDIKIDYTNSPVNVIGLDVGDGWGLDIKAAVVNGTAVQSYTATNANPCVFTVASCPPSNFPVLLQGTAPGGFTQGIPYYVIPITGTTFKLAAYPNGPALGSTSSANGTITGIVPFYHTNRVFWSEKHRIWIESQNNSMAALHDTQVPASDHSHEYNHYSYNLFSNIGQDGLIYAAGVNMGGCIIRIRGNMSRTNANSGPPTNNVAAVKIVGTDGVGDFSQFLFTEVIMKVEQNPGLSTGTVGPYGFYLDGNSLVKGCHGLIQHSLNSNSILNGSNFTFQGTVRGDSVLTQQTTGPNTPAMPGASGTPITNTGMDVSVVFSGGAGVSASIGNAVINNPQGPIFLPAGAIITPSWTTQPSWTWIPAAQMSGAV